MLAMYPLTCNHTLLNLQFVGSASIGERHVLDQCRISRIKFWLELGAKLCECEE